MVNFTGQLGWAMVPRYLVEYYSGHFCENVLFFPDKMNIETSGLRVEQIALDNVGGPCPIS